VVDAEWLLGGIPFRSRNELLTPQKTRFVINIAQTRSQCAS
jgi:hypothetical protein